MSRSLASLFPIDHSCFRRNRSRGTGRRQEFFSRTSCQISSSVKSPLFGVSPVMNTVWISEASKEFEPVLNFPAFTSFALIALVFGLLQWRIRDIDQAVNKRREALKNLREAKSLEISKGEGDNDDAIRALEVYRVAYETVEDLRQIAPGVRIRAPGIVDDENQRAAQQFLGIAADTEPPQMENAMAPKLAAGVLVVIGVSQLALLFFLLLQDDPFQSSL